jgi:hypothetical protein
MTSTESPQHNVFALDLPASGTTSVWELLEPAERIALVDRITGDFAQARYETMSLSDGDLGFFLVEKGLALPDVLWIEKYGEIHGSHILGPFYQSHLTAAPSPLLLWLRTFGSKSVGVCQDANSAAVGVLAMLGAGPTDVEPLRGIVENSDGPTESHQWFRFRPFPGADWIERDGTGDLNPILTKVHSLLARKRGMNPAPFAVSILPPSSEDLIGVPERDPDFLNPKQPPTIAEIRRAEANDLTSMPPIPGVEEIAGGTVDYSDFLREVFRRADEKKDRPDEDLPR